MKFAKNVFKPFVKLYAALGVGVVSVIKCMITGLKVKPLYKHLWKLDNAKRKLYRLLFNPYRISNGMRPTWMTASANPAADIQHCHEMVSKMRMARANA